MFILFLHFFLVSCVVLQSTPYFGWKLTETVNKSFIIIFSVHYVFMSRKSLFCYYLVDRTMKQLCLKRKS
jgi:hypothetical protein